MPQSYYQNLIKQLGNRATQSTLGILGVRNEALRVHLEQQFDSKPGTAGSYLADPVFEATFGWEESDKTMQGLAGNVLAQSLVTAMDNPPKDLKNEYRFDQTWHPYKHQLEAWQKLTEPDPHSVIVTSGTGSGKTECFLVPVLNDFARQIEKKGKVDQGVQALFLYPLNALINSQRERLRAWTHGFDRKIKFCLYNGNTPNKRAKPSEKKEHPTQVLDRQELRETPPPLLVTNATMLEYMLVRGEDAPILEQSQGTLKWIILDEAHSYIGSQAAELSLLLRRVVHAFGVKPQDLRFVATSATIGDDADKELQAFLADLAGIDKEQVSVIGGLRQTPSLPVSHNRRKKKKQKKLLNFSELSNIDAGEEKSDLRFNALAADPTALKLRDFITNKPKNAATLADLNKHLGNNLKDQDALAWLDLCSGTQKKNGEIFLPLRSHLFHRVTPGIWACPDPACSQKKGTALDDKKWPFGMVYLAQRDRCKCGTPVFDLVSCTECNEHYLMAERDGFDRLVQKTWQQNDEFSLLEEGQEDDDSEEEVVETGSENSVILLTNKLIKNSSGETVTAEILFDSETHNINELAEQAITLQGKEYFSNEIECIHCEAKSRSGRELLRRRMLGAPFHLGTVIPTTLEFCPEGKKPLETPHFGKRLITFTDSRQGTARIAVRQQQDAERNSVRAFVYHALRNNGGGNEKEIIENEEHIKTFEPLAETNSQINALLQKALEKRKELNQIQHVSWQNMCNELAQAIDVKIWMDRYYQELDRNIFGGEGVTELVGMLLSREFSMRAPRQNSLETMGLVSLNYPSLKNIIKAPDIWIDRNNSLADWQDFLKISLDFYVRANRAVNRKDDWVRWSGNNFFSRRLLSPKGDDRATRRQSQWPQFQRVGFRNRLVRMLSHHLKLGFQNRKDQDLCDDLLVKAWDDLVKCKLLQHSSDYEYYLPLEQLSFSFPQKAWICPVTNRFLDVTLKGITPYLPPKITSQNSDCGQSVNIPVFDDEEADNRQDGLRAAQEWLQDNEDIKKLRQRGLWNDLNDRIVENVRFFRVAEHSAQQPAHRLIAYEKQFKEEKINILSCSTTMEMGVDIGGISTVAMNNVPPHPANYLQRAGRAGRRNEARATAVTVCKDNAHEQMVFQNPQWAFVTPPPIPYVSLNSEPIVQRHINSMLLSAFFSNKRSDTMDKKRKDLEEKNSKLNGSYSLSENAGNLSRTESLKLTVGNFFLQEEDKSTCLSDQFIDWCERPIEKGSPLSDGIASLQKGTILEHKTLDSFISETREQLQKIKEKWLLEYSELKEQLENIKDLAGEKDPAFKAVNIQMNRMEGEYLLSELATSAFLPGYGFPLNIAALNTITVDQLKKLDDKQSRDDNRMLSRNLPSRDAATAIREYAPGANIVLDGKVYESCGLSLTWKRPMNEGEAREPQDIQLAWRCHSCGATGTRRNRNMEEFSCPECNESIQHRREFIQPSGYTVDFYETPHNDMSKQIFLPVKDPWIAIQDEWRTLPSGLGRMRTSSTGEIFIHSSGFHNKGYSLCLGCGRAEAQTEEKNLASIFQDGKYHSRPRFQKAGDECPGNQDKWLIKTDLHLGFQYQTDVFELQLNDENGIPLNNKTIAFTLVTVLRRVLASSLGIVETELGQAVIERKYNGQVVQSIILYDTNSGGSGYATQADRKLPELLKNFDEYLHCKAECDAACQQCLISYDTRFQIDKLDRKLALKFIRDTNLIERLKLPEELCFFGSDSHFENQLILSAMQQSLRHIGADKIRIFMMGSTEDTDFTVERFIKPFLNWAHNGVHVSLLISQAFFKNLDAGQKLGLMPFVGIPNLEVLILDNAEELQLDHKGVLLAEVFSGQAGEKNSKSIRWASSDPYAQTAGEDWGTSANSPLIRSSTKEVIIYKAQPIQLTDLVSSEKGDKLVQVKNELDGSVHDFGEKFWKVIQANLESTYHVKGNPVQKITYHDRYLVSPLPVLLFVKIISYLAQEGELAQVAIKTQTINGYQNRSPSQLHHNWERTQDMEQTIRGLLMKAGVQPQVKPIDRRDLPHSRSMIVEYQNGQKLTIYLDQGMGYWRNVGGSPSFDFGQKPDKQAQSLWAMGLSVQGDRNHNTHMIIHHHKT